MKRIKIRAFAKVNLGLSVLGKRKDGYHNIETILQTISLYDEIDISINGKSILMTTDNPELPLDESNLCYRAARIFLKTTSQKPGIKIHIKKNIPIGAGLGGGSSDAASVLTGLHLLLTPDISKEKMKNMAISIGSDVPFFIDGGTAFVSGKGEKIKSIKPEPFFNYLVVFPGFGIDTKWAYEKINYLTKKKNYIRISTCNFNAGDIAGNMVLLKNDFEEVVLREYKELKKIRQFLNQNGASLVSLSGSGSSIYGIFDNRKKLNNARILLDKEDYWAKEAFSIRSSEIPEFSF